MKYTDLNLEQEVGASAHYIEMGGFNILLDAGLYPKKMGLDAVPNYSMIPNDSLDFIGISHAHLDHIGTLPVIARKQVFAKILCSEFGKDLSMRMLRNSRNVMKRQRDEYGIKEYPLFENSQIDALKEQMYPMMFNKPRKFELEGNTINFCFHPAGHILGASAISIETAKESFLYTGDISFHSTHILRGAEVPKKRYDVMLVETTRGAYERPSGDSYISESDRLVESISYTINMGGSVLIPSFALGRMQEVLSLLKKARNSGKLPDCPIYASGLGVDIAEYFVTECKKCGLLNFDKSYLDILTPFKSEILPGKNFENRGIYLLGSGMMMENTPSYAAASALMDHSENAIFFVGYCDPDTPGGRLLKREKGTDFAFTNLFYTAKVNCRVDKFDLSSHADRGEILDFILSCDPRCVILTHGNEEARNWFFDNIIDLSPNTNIIIPELSKKYEV